MASLLILLGQCKASRPVDTSAAETAVVVAPFKLPHTPGIAVGMTVSPILTLESRRLASRCG